MVGTTRPRQIPQRHHPADHRRRRRVQRPPALAMEIRTRPPGRNDRPDHHRRALPTRHLEMEQNRAPAVLPDHRELARTPPDHLPDRRQSHLQHHHPHRARRPMRTRPQHLPHQDETHRPTEERHPHHPPRLPPRLELHDQQSPNEASHFDTAPTASPWWPARLVGGTARAWWRRPIMLLLNGSGAPWPTTPHPRLLRACSTRGAPPGATCGCGPPPTGRPPSRPWPPPSHYVRSRRPRSRRR